MGYTASGHSQTALYCCSSLPQSYAFCLVKVMPLACQMMPLLHVMCAHVLASMYYVQLYQV